jgi:ubiquinone/menaquinone biosynthesis C-methylase UbiE
VRAPYLMESPHEGERLRQKTDLSFAGQNLALAGLRSGMQSIDIGCGVGMLTLLMHDMNGHARTVGVDGSAARIAWAEGSRSSAEHGIEFLNSDLGALPLDSDSFDFSWSRFVFEYLPDPASVLREMIRVTRPGGIVAVADLDAQLTQFHPQTTALAARMEEALRLLAGDGFDPRIGRKLFSLFKAHSLKHIKATAVPYQTYAGGLPPDAQDNWRQKLQAAAARLTAIAPGGHWEELMAQVMEEMLRDDSFYYSTLIVVSGVK